MSFSLFGQEYFEGSIEDVADWATVKKRRGRYICVSNVHTAMQSLWDEKLRAANLAADLKVPDGRPLSLLAQIKGYGKAKQVRGSDLMLALARRNGLRHYYYGAAHGIAAKASERLKVLAPGLKVVGTESPPFRPLTSRETKLLANKFERLKVDILWVGLGAPKQEIWMAAMRQRLSCTMVGVGAAFDYYADTIPEAPRWMQRSALEWLYRLFHEPGRLWKRYLLTNVSFILLAPLEIFGLWPKSVHDVPPRFNDKDLI